MSEILAPEEQLMEYSDALLSIAYKKENEEQRIELFSQFQTEMFRDENFILYKLLKTIWGKPSSVPDRDFIVNYFALHTKLILDGREYLDLVGFDDESIIEYKKRILAKFDKITKMNIDANELTLYIEKYKLCFYSHMSDKILGIAKQMIYSEVQIGRTKYFGVEDANRYCSTKLAEVRQLIEGKDKGYIDLKSEDFDTDLKPSRVVSDFGDLVEFNDLFGKVRAPFMYSIQGGTKGGKSTLARRIGLNGVVKYKSNVLIWSTEDTKEQIMYSLRAMHYADYYDTADSATPILSAKQISDGDYPDEETRSAELVSYEDLRNNPNYGNITFITHPLTVENIELMLEPICEQKKIDIVIIDYLQEVHYGGNLKKNEAISIAYQRALQVTKKLGVALIAPAQFSQEAMRKLAESVDSKGTIDTRLLGGESSEVTRTPDANIVMYSTIEDLANNFVKFLPVPSRIAKQAPNFGAYVQFETGSFVSMSSL